MFNNNFLGGGRKLFNLLFKTTLFCAIWKFERAFWIFTTFVGWFGRFGKFISPDDSSYSYESEDDENSNDGYSEEESYDDHFDRGNNRTKIKMRRIRVSKKRKDFIPDLHLKITHLDEFENDLNQIK